MKDGKINVIHKFFNKLPTHWQELIKERGWFNLSQFNSCVSITYDDGSYMFFKHAFLVIDDHHEEIGVFTEHCGYFILPSAGLRRHLMLKDDRPEVLPRK